MGSPAGAVLSAPLQITALLGSENLRDGGRGGDGGQACHRGERGARGGSGYRRLRLRLGHDDLFGSAGVLSAVGTKPAALQDGGAGLVEAVGDAAVRPALHERTLGASNMTDVQELLQSV